MLQLQMKCPRLLWVFFHSIRRARPTECQHISGDCIYYLVPAINCFKKENTDLTEMNSKNSQKHRISFFNLVVFSFSRLELVLSSHMDHKSDTCCHCLRQSNGSVISMKFIRVVCPWTLALRAELPAA